MRRELVEVLGLEAAEKAAVDARGLRASRGGFEGENFVRRRIEHRGESDQERAVEAEVAAPVLRDERLVQAELLREVDLVHAALPNFLQPRPKHLVIGYGDHLCAGSLLRHAPSALIACRRRPPAAWPPRRCRSSRPRTPWHGSRRDNSTAR